MQIWELIATFCFFSYLQYLVCPVSHTKSLEKSMLGKVDLGVKQLVYMKINWKQENIYILNSVRSGGLLH